MSERHRVRIERLVAGGDGLGRLGGSRGGRAVFVPYAIPGETVLIEVVQRRKDYSRARIAEILEPSPDRREAFCSYYGNCGGCRFQHMSYPRQLREKSAILQETLRRTGGIDIRDIPAVPSAEQGYRTRVRLHRGAEGRPGFKAARSETVVTVDRCPVCVEPINRAITSIPLMSTETITLLASDRGVVSDRSIVVGETAGIDGPPGANGTAGVWDVSGNRDTATVTVAGRPFHCSPGAFFQSNLSLLPELVSCATAGLSGGRLLDLYCGIGLFGGFLADRFDQVVCVDRSARAVALARKNVTGAKHRFAARSVERWAGGNTMRCDAVVVDPARPGLNPRVIDYLLACGASELVYVSCNPATLARDLAILTRSGGSEPGYTLEQMRLFDFFPQTPHMEIVVRLGSRGR